MGLNLNLSVLLRECIAAYDIQGPLLSLGVPRLDFTWAQLSLAAGLPVPDGDAQATVRAKQFFKACGIDETLSLDISDYEGADVIFDLNYPQLPAHLLSRFGCILNGGTLEHVFDLRTALASITRMLKPGGIVVHHIPVHNWVDHGFYQISPTLMFDYYNAAKFEIIEFVGLLFDPGNREPWEIMPVPPGSFGYGLCGSFGTQALLCVFAARKTAEALDSAVPTQSIYGNDPVRSPPKLRWFPPFAMKDGIRIERDAYETIVLGPFPPDSGLAWYAELPAELVEGDAMEEPTRSRLALFEDGAFLGPAHTDHEVIRQRGAVRTRIGTESYFFRQRTAPTPIQMDEVILPPRPEPRRPAAERTVISRRGKRAPESVLLDLDPRRIRPDGGHRYIYPLPLEIPGGDNGTDLFQSWAQLFENGMELGPGHLSHDKIHDSGGGRFSHWENQLFFSASDNSSPILNGRRYRLLVPAGMFAPGEIDLASSLGYRGDALDEMSSMDRFNLARSLYRRLWPNTPLPDHSRRIDQDTGFAQEIARLSPEADVTHERKYNLDQLFQLVLDVEGDVSECGAYKGGSAFFLARRIVGLGLDKCLCLFDSFEGLSAPEPIDGEYWHAGAMESTIDDIKSALAPLGALSFVEFYQGWIPDRFPEVADRRFCFAHIDVDLYQPTLDSIAFFYPRVARGGIILFDDYGFSSCPGATAAIDQYMADKAEPIINLSAGGAFIMKKTDMLQ